MVVLASSSSSSIFLRSRSAFFRFFSSSGSSSTSLNSFSRSCLYTSSRCPGDLLFLLLADGLYLRLGLLFLCGLFRGLCRSPLPLQSRASLPPRESADLRASTTGGGTASASAFAGSATAASAAAFLDGDFSLRYRPCATGPLQPVLPLLFLFNDRFRGGGGGAWTRLLMTVDATRFSTIFSPVALSFSFVSS